MKTVGLYTLGCKVSQYETEAIAERFESLGYTVRPFDEKCDVYVINTCTVTAESDRKSRQIIRRAVKRGEGAIVAVVGCYSQRSASEVAAIVGVDIVIGTQDKLTVAQLSDGILLGDIPREKVIHVTDVSIAEFEPMRITKAPRTRAYVKIEDGCESKCTYCAISDARGRVRSKAPSDVISEVTALFDSGIGEVVLTGIETGSYGRDLSESYTLADLIVELDSLVKGGRIRLGSLSPELVGGDFAERIKDVHILNPHFHLSMQSGSNEVLKRMKRRYTVERALENIRLLRGAFPTLTLTTDLMVGFPGETEEDFLKTKQLVSEARFLDCHVFAYSRRARTPAADYEGQIDEDVKRQRSAELIEHKNRVRDSILAEIVDEKRELSLIPETILENRDIAAHTDSYVEARLLSGSCGACAENIIGKWVKARPVSHSDGIVYCELI